MANRQLRVYADTSVYGGVFDPEFSAPSKKFFGEVAAGRFVLVISPVVEEELGQAPDTIRSFFTSVAEFANEVEITREAIALQQQYIERGVVGERSLTDALHVAMATVSECELIVSWNFKDIVHFEKIPKYNAVNVLNGYAHIDIYSPLEVIQHDEP